MVAPYQAVNIATVPPRGVHLKILMNVVAVVEVVAAVINLVAACLHRRHHLVGLSEAEDLAKTHLV